MNRCTEPTRGKLPSTRCWEQAGKRAQNGSFGSDGSANPPPAAAAASFCFFCVARKSEKGKVYGTLASLHLAASLRGVWSPVLPRYAVSARLVRTAHNKWRSRPGQAAPLVLPVRLPQGCGTAAARLRHGCATLWLHVNTAGRCWGSLQGCHGSAVAAHARSRSPRRRWSW